MSKHYKIFVIFAIVITIIFSIKLYDDYVLSKEIKELSIKYEAKAISDFLVAFRSTYQTLFVDNHVKLDKSSIELLPVRATSEISKRFSSLNNQSKIKTVSDRPRNPVNMANPRQLEVMEYFKKNKDKKSLFKTEGDKYYYSQPLYITEVCLSCHGAKENAPKVIKNSYDSAYDYKLGELRGIIDVELSQTKLGTILDRNNDKRVIFVFIILSVILIVKFVYTRYNKKLENEVIGLNKKLKQKVTDEVEKNKNQYEQLIQKTRLAQMGEMISMIAHQWRQPLSSISAIAINLKLKLLLKDENSEAKATSDEDNKYFLNKLERIEETVQVLSTTIDDFRNFYKPDKKSVRMGLKDIVLKSLNIIEASFKNYNIEIIEDYKDEQKFDMYGNEMMQVILNILKNAQDNFIEKNVENPYIKITAEGSTLSICDNGGGIPEDIIEQIFDPYFSTKDEKNGSGLGLYMSKTIIQDHHGGKLYVENQVDAQGAIIGACFKIILLPKMNKK
ncbi:MAG: DUF3365 domain-containing protein [Sulfurimonas sp.]|nr:DUF3365 domain-containing protein [Sulfurimonas sp.]